MLQGIYGLFYGLVGSCIGSFLGLCAVRFRTEESLWGPRSHCDSCGHPLGARDLLPLFSYFSIMESAGSAEPKSQCATSGRNW